jgi:hypothetical protein
MNEPDVFPYPDRENAYITVHTLTEPYGEGSESVVSVGCTLKGAVDDPTWKVHIPIDMLFDVAISLVKRSPEAMAQYALGEADDRAHDLKVLERLNSELRSVQTLVASRTDD